MAGKGRNKTHNNPHEAPEREMKSWSDGKIVKGTKSIDSLNYALHYASPCVWEGIRAYKQEDGSTKIWRLEDHIRRLFDSAKIMGFEIPFSYNQLVQGCRAVVEANGGGDLYLRPVAYASSDAESAKPQDLKISVDIYAFPLKALHESKGIKTIISALPRAYPYYQMQAKTAENYGFLQKVKQEIDRAGVDDALIMDDRGHIVEATVANLFVVKGDVILTPPNEGSILPGITRDCLFRLITDPRVMFVRHKKIPVVFEKPITRADLYTADCVILCGTYAEVVNVVEIDGRKIGDENSRFYFDVLQKEYQRLVRGKRD